MSKKRFRWSIIAWNSRSLFVLLCLLGWSSASIGQGYIGKRLESLSQKEIPELIQVNDLAASEQWVPRTEVVPNLGLSNDPLAFLHQALRRGPGHASLAGAAVPT